jgi:hypothetical protein
MGKESDLLKPILGRQAKDSRKEKSQLVITNKRMKIDYRFMIIFTLIVGVIGIALQFIPDFELISMMLTISALGGLIGGSNGYNERDRQQLEKSYKTVFEGLLFIALAATAFQAISKMFAILEGTIVLMNNHWPGLIISILCILKGIAGFQKRIHGGST